MFTTIIMAHFILFIVLLLYRLLIYGAKIALFIISPKLFVIFFKYFSREVPFFNTYTGIGTL